MPRAAEPRQRLLKAGAKMLERVSGTKAVDASNRPLILHHGTDRAFDRFAETRDLGIHFGSRAQAARRLADLAGEAKLRGPGTRRRIVSAMILLRNPLLVPDDPVTWSSGYLIALFRRFIPDDQMPRAAMLANNGGAAARQSLTAALKKRLRAAGHDGLVYRNVVETPGRGRTVDWSWCVFDPNDIVVLGEDVAADVAAVPAQMTAAFGPTPARVDPRQIPGLRHQNGKFVYATDRKCFETEARARLTAAGAVTVTTRRRKDLAFDLPDGGRIMVEMLPAIGSIRLSPDAANEYEALAEINVCDDHGPPEKGFDRCLSFDWMPGEKIADTMDRVDRAVTAWRHAVAPVMPMRR